ncbi:MAG: MFS transporter [Dehalococcoidia bacterium]|nr:MFS transporter [Dehalococcoidia bacterium]
MNRLPPSLHSRDFAMFWTGGLLSGFGSQFTTVAMGWQIYELTGSALQVGLIGLARALPQIVLSLVGGVLADAVDRRRLLIAIQLGQCLVSAALAFATVTGVVSPSLLFLAAAALAFGTALETPSRQAAVPNLVPSAHLSSAIALNTAQRSAAMVSGPALAGVLLATVGAAPCYAVDAVSWLAMLGAVATIRAPLQAAVRGTVSVRAVTEGLHFVRNQHVVLSFMVLDFGATFFGSTTALLPIYARDILQVGPEGLGLLYSASAIGALAATPFMSGGSQVTRAGKWVPLGMIFYGACVVGFGFSRSFPLSVALMAGTGAGNFFSSVLRGTTNQLLTPDELRGRVAAVNSVFVMGGPQLGQFESGVVAALTNPQISAVTGGLAALLLAGAIGLVPEVRRFDLKGAAGQRLAGAVVPASNSTSGRE